MALDEDRECVVIMMGDELIEQLGIGLVTGILGGVHCPQILEQITEGCFGHGFSSANRFTVLVPAKGDLYAKIWKKGKGL